MRTLWLFFLGGALSATSGCSGSADDCAGVFCGALPPAITFGVYDAMDGGFAPGARINGFPCASVCPGQLPDGGLVEQAGRFGFRADAPGYEAVQFEADVPAADPVPGQCCALPFVPQHVDVPLVRL